MFRILIGILIILGFVFTYALTYYLAYCKGYEYALEDIEGEENAIRAQD